MNRKETSGKTSNENRNCKLAANKNESQVQATNNLLKGRSADTMMQRQSND